MKPFLILFSFFWCIATSQAQEVIKTSFEPKSILLAQKDSLVAFHLQFSGLVAHKSVTENTIKVELTASSHFDPKNSDPGIQKYYTLSKENGSAKYLRISQSFEVILMIKNKGKVIFEKQIPLMTKVDIGDFSTRHVFSINIPIPVGTDTSLFLIEVKWPPTSSSRKASK